MVVKCVQLYSIICVYSGLGCGIVAISPLCLKRAKPKAYRFLKKVTVKKDI